MFQNIIARLKKSNTSSPIQLETDEPASLIETLPKPTPDTMLNNDEMSNFDSFLNLEQNTEGISEMTFNSTQLNVFEEPNPKLVDNPFYEDESVLGKREMSSTLTDEPQQEYGEPAHKQKCLGISQDAQDQNLNMIDINLFQYFDREFE